MKQMSKGECKPDGGFTLLPATAVLELTYRCNQTCIFCSCPWFSLENTYPVLDEMTVDQWKKVIDTLCEQGVENIAFTGGEPLLKEGFETIISHAANAWTRLFSVEKGRIKRKEKRFNLYLLTNGLVLTKEILDLCRKLGVKISISLPGVRSFADHTGVDQAKNVLNWFGEARKRKIRTTVGVTVTRLNLPELFDTISAAFVSGADSLLMNRFLPGGRGLAWESRLSLDLPEILKMMDTAEEVLAVSGRFGSMGTEIPKCVFDPAKYKHLRGATRCSAARDFFVIDPSGFIRVCNHSPVRLSHIDQVEEIGHDAYWKRFLSKEYLPEACLDCEKIAECDGGCREAAHITGGELTAPDPLFAMKEGRALWAHNRGIEKKRPFQDKMNRQ